MPTQKPRKPLPFMSGLVTSIARTIGATVILEDEFKLVGQIRFRNGRRAFFRMSLMSINTTGAAETAKDKNYSSFFLRQSGYRVPEEKTFFSDDWCRRLKIRRDLDAAVAYGKRLGFPLIVKPNSLSQGTDVTKVWSPAQLRMAGKRILKRGILLVQRYIPGRDYRIVVLDDRVISAYERIPLRVVGDGKHTVRQLLVVLQKNFTASGRDTYLKFDDPRMVWKLKEQKLTMKSVPPKGKEIPLLDNANLSAGGMSLDVTDTMHEDYRKLSVAITKDMCLRMCGVDIITSDLTKPLDPQYSIVEINAAPGLDHYAASGARQRRVVVDLYTQVLKAIERGTGD